MFEEVAGMITSEQEGEVEFFLNDQMVFNKEVKEAPIIYKLLGESRFRLVRNNKFELVFVRLTEDWMRQAKIDLTGIDYSSGINVKFSWGEDVDNLAVKGAGDAGYQSVEAVQID